MTSPVDTLKADLGRVMALLKYATPGEWRWSENGNIMAPGSRDVDEICAVYTERDDDLAPRNAEAIIAAVNFLREHGPAIAALSGGKAEPIGWVFQHEETGRMTFCPNDGINNPDSFAVINPRYALFGPAYTTPRAVGSNSGERLVALWLQGRADDAEQNGQPIVADELRKAARMLSAAPREGSADHFVDANKKVAGQVPEGAHASQR